MASKKNSNDKKISTQTADPASIQAALDQENWQKALDLAKLYVKAHPGLEGESLLAKAYQLRIRKLHQSGLTQDAQNLIEVAKGKCPHHLSFFEDIQKETFHFPLTKDEVCKIIQSIHSSATNEDHKKHFREILSIGLNNPSHIIECPLLPEESPLKKEAVSIKLAFEAVTSSLPEKERITRIDKLSFVSRHSPLAYWCFFIRALDAYNQKDDKKALEFLNRIPIRSTLHSGKIVLSAKINNNSKPEGLSSHSTRSLWKALTPESPRSQWSDLIHTISSQPNRIIREKIKQFCQLDWVSEPFLIREITRSIIGYMVRFDVFDNDIFIYLNSNLARFFEKKSGLFIQLAIFEALGPQCDPDNLKATETITHEKKTLLSPKEHAAIFARLAKYSTPQDSEGDFLDFFR